MGTGWMEREEGKEKYKEDRQEERSGGVRGGTLVPI